MARRSAWLVLALLPALLLGGCAKLDKWLESTVGEEEKKSGTTPEEELANQQKALAGSVAADRKAAIGKLMGIKAKDAPDVAQQARSLVIGLAGDADVEVAKESMSALQTLTGFAEKTEDERQLDPEGYDQQLKGKEQVVTEGLALLSKAITGTQPDLRYGALIVLYNLCRPPVVPASAKDNIKQTAAGAIGTLARDESADLDTRLLAIEALAVAAAGDEIAKLVPLLDSTEPALQGRVALVLGQTAAALGGAKAEAATRLAKLAATAGLSDEVRWQAVLALAQIGSDQPTGLTQGFTITVDPDEADDLGDVEKVSPLEAYRAAALAACKSPEAAQQAAQLLAEYGRMATKAEEELAAERKKGYR
ncbi:MAG: hypothetical protein IT204_15280 [Fimbriimonadaceae bacterium]|nr:hypothetical protein [Fimbriimonadaceae bacterium]